MGLEAATLIHQLDRNNPTGADPKNQGDDHLRMFKACVQDTFANVDGAVLATHTQLNFLAGITGLDAGTWTPTITIVANLNTVTLLSSGKFIRIDDIVVFAAAFTLDVTTPGNQISFEVTTPVASNFSNAQDVNGVVLSAGTSTGGGFLNANSGTDRIACTQNSNTNDGTFTIMGMYRII